MTNFQTPQFIDQKAKIVGPLTLKQFGFLAVAGVVSLIAYNIFSLFLWVLITIIVGVIALSFAFIRIGGRDLPSVALSAFFFFWRPRIYTWKREAEEKVIDTSSLEKIEAARREMGLQEKLKALTLLVKTSKERGEAAIRGEQRRGYQTVRKETGERETARRVDYKE